MFIINLKYRVPLDDVNKFLEEHREWLGKLYEKNLILFSGPKVPRDGGVIVFLLDDESILFNHLKQDPFYINEIAEYSTIQINPNKCHDKLVGFIS